MEIKKETLDDREESSVNEDLNESSENESSEEGIDEKIQEAIGVHNLPASEEESSEEDTEKPDQDTEQKPDEEEEEDEVSEKSSDEDEDKDEEESSSSEESEEEDETQEQPEDSSNNKGGFSRLDKRIAKLHVQIQLMKGEEDVPTIEQVAEIVASEPWQKKQKALQGLLAQKKALSQGGSQDDSEEEYEEMSEEDKESLIEERANEKFNEMKQEIEEREWQEDLIKTVEAHPELNEKSKEYDPELADAVEELVTKGFQCSKAYEFVLNARNKVQKQKEEDEELEKQKALSGSINSTGKQTDSKKETWEDLAKLEREDPAEYERRLKAGELPED